MEWWSVEQRIKTVLAFHFSCRVLLIYLTLHVSFSFYLLNLQSDDISDEDAVANYNVYKVNFRRQQLQEFFVAHKDEEWLVF